VAVNCGAIPENLMEVRILRPPQGRVYRGGEERDGFFQAANGGTLMLDEVADLPLAMQVKLLRAIQERRVRKIGATNEEAGRRAHHQRHPQGPGQAASRPAPSARICSTA
jgi:two-component system response regulator PilR (NtrC family)